MTSEQIVPHPYACQIEGCTGRIGQQVIALGERGQIRVCLYHHALLLCSVVRSGEADGSAR